MTTALTSSVPGIAKLNVTPRYCDASVCNGIVYLAGVVPECDATDISAQTTDVLAQIDRLLTQCGSDKAHLLRVQIYLTDIRDITAMNVVWDAWVSGIEAPARATVQAALADPTWRIEVVATAKQR